jgi:DNA-binding LacI/PurR family transcriptional regulator
MVDVAGRAGVSIKTVSNVVTGAWPVAESTRARVEAVIVELDYHPNLHARALRTGRQTVPNSG